MVRRGRRGWTRASIVRPMLAPQCKDIVRIRLETIDGKELDEILAGEEPEAPAAASSSAS